MVMDNKNKTKKIGLVNKNGKYITNVNNKAILKSKNSFDEQEFTYNVHGELITNEQCLTHNLTFDVCDNVNDKDKKWMINDNQIQTLVNNELKCLSYDDNDILLNNCDTNVYNNNNNNNNINNNSINNTDSDNNSNIYDINNEWTIQNQNIFTENNINNKGKTVVLVNNENPWYINKDNTIKQPYITNMSVKSNDIYNEKLPYKTKMIIDNTKNNLGMGYSYSDRQGYDCIENFNSNNSNNYIYFIFIFIVIIFLVIRYKKN
jgi:hypothetical protein